MNGDPLNGLVIYRILHLQIKRTGKTTKLEHQSPNHNKRIEHVFHDWHEIEQKVFQFIQRSEEWMNSMQTQ